MNGYGSIWEKIPGLFEALKHCISEKWSASRSADHLSDIAQQKLSRNALIGKARRSGMAFGSDDAGQYARPPKIARKLRQVPYNITSQKAAPIELPEEPPLPPDFLGLALLDLPRNGCRYPSGDSSFLFCGNVQDGESSYCAYHRHICHVPYVTKGGKPWFALRDLKNPTSPIQFKQPVKP